MPYSDPVKQKKAQYQWYLKHKEQVKKVSRDDLGKKLDYLRKVKSVPCSDCHNSFPFYVMDLDHRDGKDKIMSVGSMIRRRGWESFVREIEKCDVVCSNCHRIRSYLNNAHLNQDIRGNYTKSKMVV